MLTQTDTHSHHLDALANLEGDGEVGIEEILKQHRPRGPQEVFPWKACNGRGEFQLDVSDLLDHDRNLAYAERPKRIDSVKSVVQHHFPTRLKDIHGCTAVAHKRNDGGGGKPTSHGILHIVG